MGINQCARNVARRGARSVGSLMLLCFSRSGTLMRSKKYEWGNGATLDRALQCWAIIWVVFGHFADYRSGSGLFQSVFLFAYSWHMPLFIFLSGLFDHPRRGFPVNKVVFYIALGFLYKLLNFYVGLPLGYHSFSLLGDSGAPWFMFCMAAWVSIAWSLRRFSCLPILVATLALSLALGYDSNIGDHLYLSRIVTLFPFYWVAFSLQPQRVVEALRSRWYLAFGLLVLLLWGFICLTRADMVQPLRPMFTWRNPYGSLDAGWIARISAYLISGVLVIAHLSVFLNIKAPSILSSIGTRTLSIYFWHEAAKSLVYASGLYSDLFYLGPIGKLLILCIGLFMCLAFSQGIFVSSIESVRVYISSAVSVEK